MNIVERLRACHGIQSGDPECYCQEAADMIERLRKTAIETMQEMLHRMNEIERLDTENEKLKKFIKNATAPAPTKA